MSTRAKYWAAWGLCLAGMALTLLNPEGTILRYIVNGTPALGVYLLGRYSERLDTERARDHAHLAPRP